MKLLDRVVESTTEYIENMPKTMRKKYGQFFTSKETAMFMARLFDIKEDTRTISILDPGAGSGILSVALLERIDSLSTRKVDLVCYENDNRIIPILKENLEYAKNNVSFQLTYEIRNKNYILDNEVDYNGMLGTNTDPYRFDIIIGNPPYKKMLLTLTLCQIYAMAHLICIFYSQKWLCST